MAIGSAPEIGAHFGILKDMTEADLDAWFAYMRSAWGGYLMTGYAKLIHNTDNPYYQEGPRWNK